LPALRFPGASKEGKQLDFAAFLQVRGFGMVNALCPVKDVVESN